MNFPFICSNIPAVPTYGVYPFQLIQYYRACGTYHDFLLTRKLLNQGFLAVKLIGIANYFHSQIVFFSLLRCFLFTVCDKGTFGEDCNNKCHCLNGVGCNHVHGQCPRGVCDAGWKSRTCSERNILY